MIKVVLVDDEPLARSVVTEYLSAYPEFEIVQECNDGFDGVKAIATHKPDLVFLDVQMPKINGFEMLELIEEPPAVIFTTAFDEFAMQAFEAHAVDYLLKPFSQDRFKKAISKWKISRQMDATKNTETLLDNTVQPEERNRIVVKKGNNIVILPIDTVHYLEAFDDYVKIHTREGFHLKKKTMAHFERALDDGQFVRIHRSYLLNLKELTRIEPLEKDSHVALLKSGVRVPLSQAGYSKLKDVLGI